MASLFVIVNCVLTARAVLVRETTSGTANLHDLATLLLNPANDLQVNVAESVNVASKKMDLNSAVLMVEKKDLPDDVSNLVQKFKAGRLDGFSEESLTKARNSFNELIEKAWMEFDNEIFQCKAFEGMNREGYAQANRDIQRFTAQITDLQRVDAEAAQGIATKDQENQANSAELAQETMLYNTEFAENKADLTLIQNDVDVFQFVLVFTKCADATSLAQKNVTVKVCDICSGPYAGHKTLVFADKSIAAKYNKLLTPSTRKVLDKLLRSVEPGSFLQTNRAPGAPLYPSMKNDCAGNCGPVPPDCALLHDKLSLLWGEFRDKLDELTMTMLANQVEFGEIKANLNAQIELGTAAKARFGMLLAEARSNMAADREEVKVLQKAKAELDVQYYSFMTECQKRISWILSSDMCGIKVVRNALLTNSTVSPSAGIQDCSMGDWVPAACTVSCDDTCTPSQPFKCGGWQLMTRPVVVTPDTYGIKCPQKQKQKRCGQHLCPTDCAMSEWSGWSACTAECEGGLESKTRSVTTKPKNGGVQCNTVEENRPCNTGSCDRDCTLTDWKRWKPCSVACGGGLKERVKHVLIPTRGAGKCPAANSEFRLQKEVCNSKSCQGDEVCIADQDLIIAIDGSGSLSHTRAGELRGGGEQGIGFNILRTFVSTMLKKYETLYYGQAKVKLGLILFGNGVIMPDGKTVSPAINAQSLTSDKSAMNTAIQGLPFKKGFTNMAQAFAMADDMFAKGSRAGAQHTVLLVSDGKPSLNFVTGQMAQTLEEKGIQRLFVIVSETQMNDDTMKNIKRWSSQPWEANLLHIPGLDLLEADYETWARRAVTKFCPMTHSPANEMYREGVSGYLHVKDAAWCGNRAQVELSTNVAGPDDCAKLAKAAGAQCFILGQGVRRGHCYSGDMKVNAAQYSLWRTASGKWDPICPEASKQGAGRCPESHPWAYRPNNNLDYCCSSVDHCGEESESGKLNNDPDRSKRSQCCKNHAYTPCSRPPCEDSGPNGWSISALFTFYALEPVGVVKCGEYGDIQHICGTYSNGQETVPTKNWHGKSADQCKALCIAEGTAGCCESRSSGFCRSLPAGSITYSHPHGDTRSTMCALTFADGTVQALPR